MSVDLVLKLVSILIARVAETIAGGHASVPVDDLFITRTAEQALENLKNGQ